MKFLPLFLVASTIPLASHAWGQTADTVASDLAGYHRVTVRANSAKVIGANFVRTSVATGNLESSSTNTLSDNDVDFTVQLSPDVAYWVEITSGANKGLASTVSSFTQHGLVTEDDLSAFCGPGDTYAVRPAHTIASLFGATNSAGLRAGASAATADTVEVPDGQGGLTVVYYSNTAPAGWRTTTTGTADAANVPVYHVDALNITRNASSNLKLTFTGSLRKNPTSYGILPGLNYVDVNYPLGTTLGNSTLQTQVKQGDSTTGDLVWIPNSATGYKKYYCTAAGWRLVGGNNADRGTVALTPGIIIERRDVAINMQIPPNAGIYGGL